MSRGAAEDQLNQYLKTQKVIISRFLNIPPLSPGARY